MSDELTDQTHESYAYGYCGMPCALCSRYRTEGKSRCPGCSADGYYTDVCKVHHCLREKGLSHCALCPVFPCVRLGKMGDFRDLTTDNVKQRTCAAIAERGFDSWYAEYIERAEMLTSALEAYNNGRMKRYLCELFIRQNIETLRQIMYSAESLHGDMKEKGAGFQTIVKEALHQ